MRGNSDRPQYGLVEVVRLTGLSKQVLHAWERRYGAVRPARTGCGWRAYSDSDVYHLQLLKRCVDGGRRIGQLVSLDNGELERLAREEIHTAVDLGQVSDLISDVSQMNAESLERRLSFQLATMGPVPFARNVIAPLMFEFGVCYGRQEYPIAGEHLISSTVRTVLGQALRQTRKAGAKPAAIFATPEGELHELGLLVAALCAQYAGFQAIYLGPQLPAKELANLTGRLEAKIVTLSISNLTGDDLKMRVAEIVSLIPEGVQLWLGGRSVKALQGQEIEGATTFDDISDYEVAVASARILGSQRSDKPLADLNGST